MFSVNLHLLWCIRGVLMLPSVKECEIVRLLFFPQNVYL